MVRKDNITMSRREIQRVGVIQQVIQKRIYQREAGEMLGVSERQIRRMVQKVRKKGIQGIVHRLRGAPSNHQIASKVHEKVVRLYQECYTDFGPTLASEKLQERQKIKVHPETLRLWLGKARIPYPQRQGRKHRRWRERKAYCGQMVQMDGSHHDWLEGRGPWMVLMGYIDDATNRVYGRFYRYEGTLPAMDSFRRYIMQYGIPQSLYVDNHDTYKSTQKLSMEEELAGKEKSQSQFERALGEIPVQLIHASSPQAKGRIERLFGTLQDRLVKELRLQGITTLEQANRFLETYWPRYNQRFTCVPEKALDLHRRLPKEVHLDSILSIKTQRKLRNDFTLAYRNQRYQILLPLRAKTLTVQEWLDGSIHLFHHHQEISYQLLAGKPVPRISLSLPKIRFRPIIKPADNHPWKKQELSTCPH